MVELALVIPVLVVIVIGALDLGRVFFALITVTNVSREGARYLTLHPDDRVIDDTDPECYDLDVPVADMPIPKPQYFCTIWAARQEAEVTLGVPVLIDPSQISITAICPDTEDMTVGCDRLSVAMVTATYDFYPMTLWFLPDTLQITKTTKMMVP